MLGLHTITVGLKTIASNTDKAKKLNKRFTNAGNHASDK